MIALFVISILVVSAIMFFGRKLRSGYRLAISLVAFILINTPTFIAIVVGDKPTPGARTVMPEEIRDSAERD